MDIDALHSALVSLTILPEELRETREELRLAHGDVLPELTLFLESIERDLRLAKAALAREIGFPVCHCCWPPELIVTTGDGEAYCAAGERREQHLAGDNCVTRATEHSRQSGGRARQAAISRRCSLHAWRLMPDLPAARKRVIPQ
jgi:transposase